MMTEQILFFVLLFVLVLLGDGKQPVVDLVATAGILSLFVIRAIEKRPVAQLPRWINFAWTAVLLYLVTRTAFSDSVGYSISATIRWTMAYLVFVFFLFQEIYY